MATKYSANGAVVENSIANSVIDVKEVVDEIVAASVKTSSMTADSRLVQALGDAAQVRVKTIDFTGQDMEAMGTNGQYPIGAIKSTWQTIELANDEGKAFDIGWTDAVKGGISDATAYDISEYSRQIVVPRIDKVRLAKLGTVGATNGKSGAAPTKANIYSEIMTGLSAIANNFAVDEGCTIYIPNTYAAMLDMSSEITSTRDTKNSSKTLVSRVGDINGNTVVRVPDSYMSGVAFGIHAPNTIMGIDTIRIKHVAAENNTRGDGDFIGFHVYHDAICMTNKVAGTYAYTISTGA